VTVEACAGSEIESARAESKSLKSFFSVVDESPNIGGNVFANAGIVDRAVTILV
jgi:hypothetical protein